MDLQVIKIVKAICVRNQFHFFLNHKYKKRVKDIILFIRLAHNSALHGVK